jgi:hypothetical protein
MAVSAEDRQLSIDLWTEMLTQQGMDEDRAEEFATMVTDEAIKQQDS